MDNILDKIKSPDDIKGLDNKSLELLASNIREFLLQNVSKTGGHLASNLGVVELTLAIHSVYNAPEDIIIWDVGHQTYVHKILTGRKQDFGSLRQYGGISGFPKVNESIYDVFQTGHSSTSISAALGMSRARDIKEDSYNVVAVIGDGALTGGMAFEALNDAGYSKTNMTVILNDNQMSISKNVGSLSTYLSKLRTEPVYFKFKEEFELIMNKIPGIGKNVAKTADKLKDSIKYLIVPGMLFEDLGFTYLGPIDGHNVQLLKDVLERSRKIKGPVLVHVITQKGRGYDFAEKNPDKYHGVGAFDVESGEFINKGAVTYSDAFGDQLVKLASKDKRVVAITAAMREGTGLKNFSKIFPERFFDVGIAEQHAVTLAAGLAANGMRPVFAVYSTFLQRAYDQILHDVCIQKLPVILAIDRGGIVGEDGETHHGVFDLSFLRHMPNIVIMSPKNIHEFKMMIELCFSIDCPAAIRYPRGADTQDFEENNITRLEPYKAEILCEGKDVLIVSVGRMVGIAYKAVNQLKKSGISVGLINARFIKPLDKKTLLTEIKKYKSIITIEDNVIHGGFGSSILEFLCEHNISDKKLKILGFPDEFIPHGDSNLLFKKYGLDVNGIVENVLQIM